MGNKNFSGYRTSGFTLLELSIVLIIIGLVISSVLVGRELIYASEIRKTVRQIAMLDTGIGTFRAKYKCIPGDCASADSIGLTPSPNTAIEARLESDENHSYAWFNFISSAYGAPVPPPESIEINMTDGNGNEYIDTDNEYYNLIYFLHQLGMLSGMDMTSYALPLSIKAPSTANAQGFWYVRYLIPVITPAFDTGTSSVDKPGNYYWATSSITPSTTGTGVLSPKDAQAIDNKRDDGRPRSGLMLATSRNALPPVAISDGPYYDAGTDSGAAGASSNFCVVSGAQPYYNTANISRAAGSLCTITIKTSF